MSPYPSPTHIFLMIAFLLVSVSCTPKKIQVDPGIHFQDALPSLNVDRLLEILEGRSAGRGTFKGLVQIHYSAKSPGGEPVTGKISGAVFYEQGGTWRFKGFDLIGRTVVDLLVTQEGFQLAFPTRNERLVGTLDQIETLPVHTGIYLPPNLLTLVNALGPFRADPLERPFLEVGEKAYLLNFITLDGPKALLNRRIWVDRNSLNIEKQGFYNSKGGLETLLLYENHRQIDGIPFPFRITALEKDRSATLIFEEVDPHPVFGEDDFKVDSQISPFRLGRLP